MGTPTLRQLQTFIAAVETGSITEAARLLHLTQPAASQQLRSLQHGLGVRLLDRAEGRVIPTAAGAAILAPARRAQEAAMEATAAAASFRSNEAGRLRLGTGATACIFLLPPVLAAAKQRMPGLEIIVATGNSPDILRRVEDGTLDAGLVTLPGTIRRNVAVLRVLQDPLLALVPGNTPGTGMLTPAQMADLPLILFETGGDTRRIVDGWFRAAGLAPRPIMELGSVEAIKVLVGSGLGASILPGLALRDAVTGAETHPLRPHLARELGLVMRKEKRLDRSLRLLIEELTGLANPPPPAPEHR